MAIKIEDHQQAVRQFLNAATRSDGESENLTEFGLILCGAGVPTWVVTRTADADDGSALRDRFRIANFLRDWANKIEARDVHIPAEI